MGLRMIPFFKAKGGRINTGYGLTTSNDGGSGGGGGDIPSIADIDIIVNESTFNTPVDTGLKFNGSPVKAVYLNHTSQITSSGAAITWTGHDLTNTQPLIAYGIMKQSSIYRRSWFNWLEMGTNRLTVCGYKAFDMNAGSDNGVVVFYIDI